MSKRSQIAPISRQAFDTLAQVTKQIRQTLPPIRIPRRKTYDQYELVPMVVSAVGSASDPGGVGENVCRIRTYTAGNIGAVGGVGEIAILVRPLQEPIGITVQELTGTEVKMSSRMLPGPIFTGQVCLMAPIRTYSDTVPGNDGDVEGDYVSGCVGYRWNGTMVGNSQFLVDLTYQHNFGNKTAKRSTCRVIAGSNNTGVTLQKGQNVIVDWIQDKFVITDYQCLI